MNYKTIRTVLTIIVLIGMGTAQLSAQAEEHGRRTDAILAEIMQNQNVESIGRINPDEVSTELLEELGDAVMGLMIADEEQHAAMDRMMGGEGSQQLTSTHRWLGYRYLQNGGNLSGMGWGPGMMGGRGWGYNQFGMTTWQSPWIWIPVLLILVLLVVGSIVIINRKKSSKKGPDSPLEILRARYARGEISREEFMRIREELK